MAVVVTKVLQYTGRYTPQAHETFAFASGHRAALGETETGQLLPSSRSSQLAEFHPHGGRGRAWGRGKSRNKGKVQQETTELCVVC